MTISKFYGHDVAADDDWLPVSRPVDSTSAVSVPERDTTPLVVNGVLGHRAQPEIRETLLFDDDEEVIKSFAHVSPRSVAPTSPCSDEALQRVLARFGIDLSDLRANKEIDRLREGGDFARLDPTMRNIALVLMYGRDFSGKFRLNEMRGEQEYDGERMTSATDVHLKYELDGLFRDDVPMQRVRDAVCLACDRDRYNPLGEYIDALPVDGTRDPRRNDGPGERRPTTTTTSPHRQRA